MKTISRFLRKAFAFIPAALACPQLVPAQPTVVDASYSIQTFYTHTNADNIISYDWDASANLHYMTSSGFPDLKVWRKGSGALENIYAAPNNFVGASLVSIGDTIYFNDSDFASQFIRGYVAAATIPAVPVLSTTPNYGLYGRNGNLFITGADSFGPNQIYFSNLAANGDLLDDPAINLGVTSAGSSGPLTFDLAGNLYYAPGFGDLSIYKFTAAEVNAALADPAANSLTGSGNLWLDYTTLYPNVSGATSLLFDAGGKLLVTLTSFTNPSALAAFGTSPAGAYNGINTTILTSMGTLGELRSLNGNPFISTGNEIVQIVPEPASFVMIGLAAVLFVNYRRVRSSFLIKF